MLTEPILFSRYGTEPPRDDISDDILLNDPAEDFDAEMLQKHNGHTAHLESGSAAGTGTSQTGHSVDRHFIRPVFNVVQSDFKLLQLWQGRVEKVGTDEFVTTLFDKTHPLSSPEQVSISIEDVNLEDRELLRPGAVFYWSIGYANYYKGPRQRTSRIRFRRLVIPKRKMVERKNAAKQLATFFARH